MRPIDADALEELFREVIGGIAKKPEMNGNLEHMVRASAMVIEMIKDAPTIEPDDDRWIPCSERLPEERDSIFAKWYGTERWRNAMFRKTSEQVIVTIEYEDGERSTDVTNTIDGRWSNGVPIVKGKVIAWMPLPEPYQGGNE